MVSEEEARSIVAMVADLLSTNEDVEDDRIVGLLTRRGIPALHAELALVFLPTAFARLVIRKHGIRFVNEFKARNQAGRWIPYRLLDHPIYAAAAHLAAQLPPAKGFAAIAKRSAELNVLSDALDAGLKVKGGTYKGLYILRVSAEDLGAEGRLYWWERLAGRLTSA